jgi:hypothetical protein
VLERIVSGRAKNHQLRELLAWNWKAAGRSGRMSARRRSAHPPMTAVAMPLDKLDLWLQGRAGAAAANLAMLDGFVTAIVAGARVDGPARVDLSAARHRERRLQS